jgi:hypothetical protein
MENIWPIILVGVIAAIAGYVFGMIDSRVTTVLKEGREKIVESEAEAAQKLDEHNVLKVTVDPALKWHLELDGIGIEPDGLTAEQRTRLVNVLVQIRPWIDGKTVSAPAPITSAPPASISAPPQPASSAPIVPPPIAGVPATGNPRLDFGRGFRSLLDSDIRKPEPPKGTSIVSMIDEVLQRKLENSPLAGKKIRLEEGSIGEVIVFVGIIRYSGIDAVPDEDIKAIIRAAIAEWDRK